MPSRSFQQWPLPRVHGFPSHPTTPSLQSISIHVFPPVLLPPLPPLFCTRGCHGLGSEERKGRKEPCPVFKMPINIIGSWDTLKCLIWNVLCYLSFQGQGKKRPLRQRSLIFQLIKVPMISFDTESLFGWAPGAADLAELGMQHAF